MISRPGLPLRRFRYRAVSPDGAITRGVLSAADIDAARSRLVDLRLSPIALTVDESLRWRRPRISDADLAIGARILADLLGSGLSISRALRTFEDLAPAGWQRHAGRLHEDVRAGGSLSSALANLDGATPPLFIGLVRAGEMAGGLPIALDSVATLYETVASARSALISALTYPAFLLVVCLGAVTLLGGVVLPRFALLLNDLGHELPTSTAALMSVSEAARAWGPLLLLLFAAGVLVLWTWASTESGRRGWHSFLLALPVIGEARHAWASATVCATTGALVQSGIMLSTALHHAAGACGDAAISARIMDARQAVLAGSRPSDALAERRALTRAALRLVRSAEESGKVAATLLRASQLERGRALRTLQTTMKLIEPTLVVVFGGLVAFVATALLQAVYAIRPGS